MPSAQIEQSEKFIRFFTGPIAIAIWSIIGTPIIGAVLSMIVGAFMKRAPAPSAVPPLPAV